jgi:hypothetical protein
VWLENILHVGVPLGGYTRDLVDQYICPARPSPVPGSFTLTTNHAECYNSIVAGHRLYQSR